MNLSGKHLLVLGLGESGLAMAKWATRQGAVVRVADSRVSPPTCTICTRMPSHFHSAA